MVSNNQTLPDGRHRLVLNGSCAKYVLSMSGTLNSRFRRSWTEAGDSPLPEFRPSMLLRYSFTGGVGGMERDG
ncbi:MAG: hypothetical protein LBQ79_02165 [Deltaproteobacteria bacterium]|jgi:hypothetical protein|nr:hypothetical protein [Deltaproteobacteria bacterium]